MSKKIVSDQRIYVAPGMIGDISEGIPRVIDEFNGSRLLDPKRLSHKILIYEREVTGWFINPAKELLKSDSFSNGFIILMVCMAYFEGVEQYRQGSTSTARSREIFTNALDRVYNGKFTTPQIESLYNKCRCGLFHNGMVKNGILFNSTYPDSIEFTEDNSRINVNQAILLNDVERDFTSFISCLMQGETSSNCALSDELRNNFDQMFNVV